jgi:heterodisulfide reductase subunit A-like polyferredoxin
MNDVPARNAQRLVDPEVCSACFACFEVCPKGAVDIRGRQVAIDPQLCENCGACVAECSTGAIDVTRMVPADAPYSLDEQFGWDRLPPEEF